MKNLIRKTNIALIIVIFGRFALSQEAPPLGLIPAPQSLTATPSPAPAAPVPTDTSTASDWISQAPFHVGAVLDLYAPVGLQNSTEDDDRARARSVGILAFGKIDDRFDIFLDVTARDNTGTLQPTLEEGYVTARHVLPNSEIKFGKFYLGIGRLNQQRQYEWSFINTPIVQSKFFGDPGALDTGAEYTWSAVSRPLHVTAGVTNGYSYGYSETNSGSKPLMPTIYLHPSFLSDLNEHRALLYGATYLTRQAADGSDQHLAGLDLTYKRLGLNDRVESLWQSEFYYRYFQAAGLPLEEDVGGYVYTEHALSEKWSTGLRLDLYTDRSLTDVNGNSLANLEYAFIPVLIYQASSASTLRAAYTADMQTRDGSSNHLQQKIEFQFVAFIGARPHHDF